MKHDFWQKGAKKVSKEVKQSLQDVLQLLWVRPYATVTISASVTLADWGWGDRFISTRVSSSAESPSKAQSSSDMFGSSFNLPCPVFTVSPVKSVGSASPHPTRSSALWFLCYNTSKLLAQCRLRGGQRYNLQSPTCAEPSSDWTGPSGPAAPSAVAPLLPQFGRVVA